ncbi:MBL fold metallo-hydrolase [Bordetella bronchialis]|uniref:MBL fold metallo-hydrolase n=1 Tax=Bordetella bronchialis TaxID=463025 RepID=A0A193FEM1_9BORD|nr:MBL fold metallo-hydrolase [Bordetella bronchialis]ANN66045.1 MBL fold metallo-hydrolase [Bordetella bronchialis]ANN71130.1 MBL fold metallo-hydrolase [Bordetella bronchialis]
MRIHHLNCISSCPLGGHLMDGRSDCLLCRGTLCCHCILIETPADGLVLIDTGFGLRDVRAPRTRLSAFFLALLKPDFKESMTAVRQIERLGYQARDVRHIVLTHLDFDHAGGLDDFPDASVHLSRPEREAAARQSTWLDRQRYRPQQWSSRRRWKEYAPTGDDWFGFQGTRPIEALHGEVALVPLHGHTLGHAGVAVRRGDGWLLQAGDAYFYHQELDHDRPRCTPGLRLYQWMMEKDRGARLHNQARLRELRHRHGGQIAVCCSHDPHEFDALRAGADAAGPLAQPAAG